jgi:hypothetical protein
MARERLELALFTGAGLLFSTSAADGEADALLGHASRTGLAALAQPPGALARQDPRLAAANLAGRKRADLAIQLIPLRDSGRLIFSDAATDRAVSPASKRASARSRRSPE